MKYNEATPMLFIDIVYSQVVLGSCGFLQRHDFAIDPEHTYLHTSIETRHAREFEADAFGLRVTLAASISSLKAYVVVFSLLGLFHLFERGQNLMDGDDNSRRSTEFHPSAAERRTRLRILGEELIAAADWTEAQRAADMIEDDSLQLWLPLENALWRYRETESFERRPVWPPEPISKRAGLRDFIQHVANVGSRDGLTLSGELPA